jgi:hypothetical protein
MKYSKKHRTTYRKKGGNVGTTVNYGNASNWMLSTVGTKDQQYNNVFDSSKPYSNYGNTIVSLDGKHHAGGRRIRNRISNRRGKGRGGNLAQVINQAVVPFGLLGLQQSYRRKNSSKKGGGRTRRYSHKY